MRIGTWDTCLHDTSMTNVKTQPTRTKRWLVGHARLGLRLQKIKHAQGDVFLCVMWYFSIHVSGLTLDERGSPKQKNQPRDQQKSARHACCQRSSERPKRTDLHHTSQPRQPPARTIQASFFPFQNRSRYEKQPAPWRVIKKLRQS